MTQTPLPMGNAVRVILVPYPVSVVSSFAYYVLGEMGLLSPHVFYRWRSFDQNEDGPSRICLFGPNLFEKVLAQLQDVPTDSRYRIRRILNFCQSPYPDHRLAHSELQSEIARIPGPPREVLEVCASYWRHVVNQALDPFRNGLPPFSYRCDGPPEEPLPGEPFNREMIYLTRPKYEGTDGRGRAVMVGYTEFQLEETRARLLARKHLAVGVFGPSSVSKSGVVASLVVELSNLVKSLSTRTGWENFKLKVDRLDLDLGTPTLSAIERGEGQNRKELEKQKRPWTMEMALDGLQQLENAQDEANLLVVDLPGKITGITELLSTSLDGGILVIPSGENGHSETWGKFLKLRLGIEELSLIFSMSDNDGEESQARAHQHHRTARGQIVNFKRIARPWNPYIGYLAKVLLYDLLPGMVEKRHNARKKLLR